MIRNLIITVWLVMLTGCTSVTTEYFDKDGNMVRRDTDARCVVQSHTVVLGLDAQIFDFMMTGGSSPTKIRLGYITSDVTVTPIGMGSEFTKTYDNVLWGTNKYTTSGKAYMVIGKGE